MSPLSDTDDGVPPRAGAVLVACLVGFLGGQVVAISLVSLVATVVHYPGGFNGLAQANRPPWWANVLSLAGLWVGFAGAISYAHRRGRLSALADQWRVRPSDALYLLLGVACQVVVALCYAPFHVKNLDRPVHHLFDTSHGATLVLLGLLTTICAPVLEEWFFRGVVFRALLAGLSRFRPTVAAATAVLSSAVLFGLAHGEPAQFAGLGLLGVVLAVLVYRTQRLVPSIITHVSFNTVAFAALLAQRSGR